MKNDKNVFDLLVVRSTRTLHNNITNLSVKTYIALFLGINVGGNNILIMKKLSGILEGLGYANVKTYIQSSYVVTTRETTKPEAGGVYR